jgi:hypothetical protein
VLDIGQ